MTIHTAFDQLNEVVEVIRGDGDGYTSKLVTKVPFKAGQVVFRLEGLTTAPKKRYTTVQVGPDEHVELNSDLVYMNHSCDPSVILDTLNRTVTATRDLKAGDELCFFYPSSEWDMIQPFPCWCGAEDVSAISFSLLWKTSVSLHLSHQVTQLL